MGAAPVSLSEWHTPAAVISTYLKQGITIFLSSTLLYHPMYCVLCVATLARVRLGLVCVLWPSQPAKVWFVFYSMVSIPWYQLQTWPGIRHPS